MISRSRRRDEQNSRTTSFSSGPIRKRGTVEFDTPTGGTDQSTWSSRHTDRRGHYHSCAFEIDLTACCNKSNPREILNPPALRLVRQNSALQQARRMLICAVKSNFKPMRHIQKELARASNPGVLPFSVDAPETKTTLLGASVSDYVPPRCAISSLAARNIYSPPDIAAV